MINSFVEDWLEGDHLRGAWASKFPSGQYLFYYPSIIHYLTQLYVFIEHLTIEGLYQEGLSISIIFNELKDRRLHLDSENHMPLMKIRTTKTDKITINRFIIPVTGIFNFTINRFYVNSGKLILLIIREHIEG